MVFILLKLTRNSKKLYFYIKEVKNEGERMDYLSWKGS